MLRDCGHHPNCPQQYHLLPLPPLLLLSFLPRLQCLLQLLLLPLLVLPPLLQLLLVLHLLPLLLPLLLYPLLLRPLLLLLMQRR